MFINKLNYFLFLISIIFEISLGTYESSSDEDNSSHTRSRRQFDTYESVNSCTDACIMATVRYFGENFSVLPISQTRKECRKSCEEEAKRLLEIYKKNQQEQDEQIVKEYHHPSQSISSDRTDCEIKCLGSSPLKMKKKKKLCRIQCASF